MELFYNYSKAARIREYRWCFDPITLTVETIASIK